MMPIQTVEDYLNLADWKWTSKVEEGTHAEFFWFRSSGFMQISMPEAVWSFEKPVRFLVTYWDYSDGAAKTYGRLSGWRKLGDFAVSDFSLDWPELNFYADCGQMVLDEPVPDEIILEALSDFDEPRSLDDIEHPNTARFWSALETLLPSMYFSFGIWRGMTLITRDPDFYKQFRLLNPDEKIEEVERAALKASRAKLWDTLGPECGPEKCVEPDCDRYRIKLAVRCFIHQNIWNDGERTD